MTDALAAVADLHTERLVLHPMTPEEAERVVAETPGAGDLWGPEYPDAMDVEGATDLLKACATTGDPRPFGNYEIRRRADGRAIGGIGFNRTPDAEGTVTVGYSLNASARGRGYASEALRALLAFAWSRGVTLVQADADLDNLASQHVMTAVGMRAVGEDHRVRYFEMRAPGDAAAQLGCSPSS
ncbi:GNAT family N-acetyltransferase [Streptomyces smyrnaeus]|uniref:GNAT family N-acetyltransferase n=1 Tax=Streptomyces smyrnaeus TaxID=1387713 RepID=UPI00339EBA74